MNHVLRSSDGIIWSDDTLESEDTMKHDAMIDLASRPKRVMEVVEVVAKYKRLADVERGKHPQSAEPFIVHSALELFLYTLRKIIHSSKQQDDIMNGGVFDG